MELKQGWGFSKYCKKKKSFCVTECYKLNIYFSSVSAATIQAELIPKILFEMLSAAENNSLTKAFLLALVEQQAAEINAVDVMRYSAQRIILVIFVY